MRINSRMQRPTTGWDERSGYPNELAAGSPEHNGAHGRLLELAIEMESDFEPYGKRSREGTIGKIAVAVAGILPS